MGANRIGMGLRMGERPRIRTLADLARLDSAEIFEGYRDGLAAMPPPGDNRSDSYWHGFRNGQNDRTGKVDEDQRALAKAVFAPTHPEGDGR